MTLEGYYYLLSHARFLRLLEISIMGTKNKPDKFNDYASAEPDEPMFILLARDPTASRVVQEWALLLAIAIMEGRKPKSDRAIVEEARECAKAMREFREDRTKRSIK